MKKCIKYFIIIALVMLMSGFAYAAIPVGVGDWTGSRSTPSGSGVVGAGGWSGTGNNGFKINWSINKVVNTYNYSYTLAGVTNGLSKALSHWILEVTNPSTSNDFFSLNLPISSDSPKTWTPGGSNPNMPSNIYGIKWDTTGDPSVYTSSFSTLKNPVWGDFFAKSGKDAGIWTTAWNTGFGTDPTSETTVFTNWIPTPNGDNHKNPVPEPATMILVSFGFIGLSLKKLFLSS